MSMYKNNTNNQFVGYFTDLSELLLQHPVGLEGEYAIINDVSKKYYWDISSRTWEDGGSIDATEETLINFAGFNIPSYDEVTITRNVNGAPTLAVFKLASVTVCTLTITLDADDNIINVLKS